MSYISHTPIITVNGQTWWINARKSGVYTAMLKRIIGQLTAMLSHHNKIHVIRFDLSVDDYTDNNQRITDFNRRLFGKLDSRYQLTRIAFAWVREMEKAKQQHYHYLLILDGNKVQHPDIVQKIITDTWQFEGGRHWKPKNCYYNIARDQHEQLQNAIFRLSYLAKGRGKGYKPSQTKNYSTSRIKPKGE